MEKYARNCSNHIPLSVYMTVVCNVYFILYCIQQASFTHTNSSNLSSNGMYNDKGASSCRSNNDVMQAELLEYFVLQNVMAAVL